MRAFALSAAALLTATSVDAAAITVFTDETAYLNAVAGLGGTSTFITDFTGFDPLNAGSLPLLAPIAVDGARQVFTNNSGDTVLRRISGTPTSREDFTQIRFSEGVRAVSFDINNFGAGEESNFQLQGQFGTVLANQVISGPSNGFFGAISDVSFRSFTWIDTSEDSASFSIDDLSAVAAASIEPIPVPASLPLLAGALGVVGWMGRRRKKS